MNNNQLLSEIVGVANKHRANNIEVLDISDLSVVGRYFVIMDAPSKRQVKAISQAIIDKMGEDNQEILRTDGEKSAAWILLDLGDIIIHIFQSETRSFYNLEKLWSDARDVDVSDCVTED